MTDFYRLNTVYFYKPHPWMQLRLIRSAHFVSLLYTDHSDEAKTLLLVNKHLSDLSIFFKHLFEFSVFAVGQVSNKEPTSARKLSFLASEVHVPIRRVTTFRNRWFGRFSEIPFCLFTVICAVCFWFSRVRLVARSSFVFATMVGFHFVVWGRFCFYSD